MDITTVAPTLTTVYKRGLPSLDLPTLSTATFTTPSISVPPNDNNPYILSETNPNGTVFIAFGVVVGVILLGFIMYHLILSLSASRLAKKAFYNDKQIYEKYQNNNNTAYGLTPSSTNFNLANAGMGTNQSVSKLPLLSHHPTKSFGGSTSQLGDISTLYQSEIALPASKNDMTKMFISPTAEVMSHKRVKSSQYSGSLTNLSHPTGSHTNLSTTSPMGKRHSAVPNLYLDNEVNNSDYSLSTTARSNNLTPVNLQHLNTNSQLNTKHTRNTIPSMYLEDLIDE